MARDAVWTLLNNDATLTALGGAGFVAIPQFEADQKPDADAFIVICWRHTDFDEDMQENTERHFELYVHIPSTAAAGRAGSTDFGRIDNMIDQCDKIFAAVEDATDPVIGADGWQLNFVRQEGRGPDVTDQGYQTICKQASYMALCCKTT